MVEKDLLMAHSIAEAVASAGGRTYFVGGYVRDQLRGVTNDDVDIEVHGITPEALRGILEKLGRYTVIGASFGVYGIKGCGLDIAMPRRERAIGRGHRDFEIYVDPFIGTHGAAIRRDFTINAMMRDVLTGELVDHFGGERDLKDGILRHVNDATFAEDPLRVFRAAQFAARFGFKIADETVELCRTMDLAALSRERILGELGKALLKADKPSVFFQILREMDQLNCWFPELAAIVDVPQEPRYHPEGDVWTHTLMVIDAAATLREHAQHPLGFMLSATLHDLGKAETTTREEDGRIRAVCHELASEKLARRLLERLTNESKLIRYVLNMVRLHMRPNLMAEMHSSPKAMAKLYDESICPEDLILLARADRMGQGIPFDYSETERFLYEQLDEYREIMARPYVTGTDLIAAGMQPGVTMGEALRYAHKLRLAGIDKDNALRQTLTWVRNLEKKD